MPAPIPLKTNLITPKDVSEGASDLLRGAMRSLRSMQQSIDLEVVEGRGSDKLARTQCDVSRTMIALSAELRQRDKAAEKAMEELTPEEEDLAIAEYLRTLTPDRVKRFRAILDGLGDKVLGR